MWNLYNLSKATFQAPSQVMNLELWLKQQSPETWKITNWLVNYQFDHAVIHFGMWVEGRLNELDKDGKQKYKADSIFMLNADRKKKSLPLKMALQLLQ